MGASAAALGLALTTGTGSVDGFVASPPPVGGAHSSALLQRSTNVLAVSSLADYSPRTKTATSMSLKPLKDDASGSRLPRWMLPRAARDGVGRRLSFMRRAAERDDRDDKDEEDEEDDYEDGDMEEYRDDAGLDRYER